MKDKNWPPEVVQHFKDIGVLPDGESIKLNFQLLNINSGKILWSDSWSALLVNSKNILISLVKNKFNIPESSNSSLIIASELELVIMPLVAFDNKGYRLGYGGGYYDNTFRNLKKKKHKFISIAVAFDGQKVEEVKHDHQDKKINYIY